MTTELELDALFAGRDPVVRDIYERLISRIAALGVAKVEPKSASIHLARRSAFAGVHPRKTTILLNIRSDTAIPSPRIRKCEQVSKNRFHNETLLGSPDEVDDELTGWLATAFALSA